MTKNALVNQVLATRDSCAPEMTHALSNLGGGDMGTGITALWSAGNRNGMIRGASITSLVFSLGIGAGMLLLQRHYENQLDEIKQETTYNCINLATSVCENGCKNCTNPNETEKSDASATKTNS